MSDPIKVTGNIEVYRVVIDKLTRGYLLEVEYRFTPSKPVGALDRASINWSDVINTPENRTDRRAFSSEEELLAGLQGWIVNMTKSK